MSIRLVDAEVRFGGVKALQGASVDIEPGVVTAVLGPNAAGKSTLLRAMAGLQRLHAGAVSIDGRDLASMAVRELLQQQKRASPVFIVVVDFSVGASLGRLMDDLGSTLNRCLFDCV